MPDLNWAALYGQFPGLEAALGQARTTAGQGNQIGVWGGDAQVPAWRGVDYWRNRAPQYLANRPQGFQPQQWSPQAVQSRQAPQFPQPQVDPGIAHAYQGMPPAQVQRPMPMQPQSPMPQAQGMQAQATGPDQRMGQWSPGPVQAQAGPDQGMNDSFRDHVQIMGASTITPPQAIDQLHQQDFALAQGPLAVMRKLGGPGPMMQGQQSGFDQQFAQAGMQPPGQFANDQAVEILKRQRALAMMNDGPMGQYSGAQYAY